MSSHRLRHKGARPAFPHVAAAERGEKKDEFPQAIKFLKLA
jgi:hypothetical protein